jgi:cephalosporin hydroxylase
MKADETNMMFHMPFLAECASKAAFVLEIGVGWGNGSTRAFANGLKRSLLTEKLHIGVDLEPGLPNPELGFEAPESDYWQLVLGASENPETAKRILGMYPGRAADIIFIDTDHRKEQLASELRIWDIFATSKTLWIFHDIYMMGTYNRMTEAILEYCVEHPQWEYIEHSRESHGLGLMKWREPTIKRGLNMGCGDRIFKSNPEIRWTNLDIKNGAGVDWVGDWRNCLQGCKFDIVVAHHTWEHEGCGEQPVTECWNVLSPGGSLIVSVPDIRKLAHMWLNGEMSTQLFMTNVYGPYDGTLASRHFWGFDSDSLKFALSVAPWKEIKSFDWRAIPGAEIARDDRWILCMEAIK